MIIKNSQLKKNYEVVIIGAGIAGLSLAKFLNTEQKKILIVESGDFKFKKDINKDSFALAKNLGNWPTDNYAAYYSRVRMFGGNANVWGGWCMELDEYDFRNSKEWNSIKTELKSHYKNAYEILNIKSNFINKKELDLISVEPYSINVARGSFIDDSKKYLNQNENIDVLIKTKLDKIIFNKNKIVSIDLKNTIGEENNIALKTLVISTGGIETIKILNNNLPKNIKNPNIGKYFMEHPQIQVGRVVINRPSFNKFIEKYSPPTVKHLFDDKLKNIKPKIFTGFKPTNKKVRNYFVLRASNVYQSKALYRLRHMILTKSIFSIGKIQVTDIVDLIFDILDMFFKKIKNFLNNEKSYSVVLHLEQKPDINNQVKIENNNIVLDWNFTKDDFLNFKNSLKELNNIFNEMNADFKVNKVFQSGDTESIEYLKKNIFGIGHHMGTTRIGLDKKDSVCDYNLKYHEIDNLYINSTSVFPTGGIANPTLTLLALASRLAERINIEKQ